MVEKVELTNNTLIKNINSSLVKKAEEVYEQHPWVRDELRALEHLSFDEEGANKLYRAEYEDQELGVKELSQKKLCRLHDDIYSLSQMFSKDKRLTRISVKNGRVFHPLTYCKKEFRQFVNTPDGKSVVEIDLKSAQFFFLCQAYAIKEKYSYKKNLADSIIKHLTEPIKLSEEIELHSAFGSFMHVVIGMDIYQDVYQSTLSRSYETYENIKLDKDTRDWIKLEFISKVLYGYHSSIPNDLYKGKKPIEQKLLSNFYEQYGPVMDFIKQIADECAKRKADGSFSKSSCLAKLLQNLEGYFFHHLIRQQLHEDLKELGYFIVHDAIYVDSNKGERVRGLLNKLTEQHYGETLDFGKGRGDNSDICSITLCITPAMQKDQRLLTEMINSITSPSKDSNSQ